MDAKLLFWSTALANLAVICGLAVTGVRFARRGEIARHRRAMKTASWLILAFLGAYLAKVGFLGREDQSVWTRLDVWVLRIHELFILIMGIAGGVAWRQGRRLALTVLVTHNPEDPEPDTAVMRTHRLAGWTAVISSLLAFVFATGVLAGMIARL
jgi:uncharacterized membrane protein YozB (DUF420 family)